MGAAADTKGIGLVIARVRDAGLPDRAKLEVGGIPLWRRALQLCKAAGLDPVILGSDSKDIVDAASSEGVSGYLIDGIAGLGGCSDGEVASRVLRKYEAEKGPLDDREVIAVPDIGAVCLEPSDIAGAVGLVWPNGIVQGCVTTSVNLPIYLINYRKGQRVLWHQARTKMNRKGVTVNGALYVVRAGYLKATNSLLTQKSLVFPIPKERAIVASDPWDFLSAQSYWEASHGSVRG